MKSKYLPPLSCLLAIAPGCQRLARRSPAQLWRSACASSDCDLSCDSLSSAESGRQVKHWGTPIEPHSDPSAIAAHVHGDEWTVNRYRPSSKTYHFQDKAPGPLAKTDKPERIKIENATRQPLKFAAARGANVLPASFSVSADLPNDDSGNHRISDSLHISEATGPTPNVIQVHRRSLSEDLVNHSSGVAPLQPSFSTMAYGSNANAEIVIADDVPNGSDTDTEAANLQEASQLELE